MLSDQQYLRIPGPTPIPPSVERAMTQPMIGHRSADFKSLLRKTSPRLKPVFGTEQEVYILTGSGTSGLEAAVVNSVQPGEAVLVLVTGAFGERFVKICEAYDIVVHRFDVPWGESADPADVRSVLENQPEIRAVFVTFCETSTGVVNPVEALGAAVREASDALFIVDGVSCVGGVKTEMDAWGIDILITGSQKAMMLPAGLTFLSASERAWKRIEANSRPRFYLDLRKFRKSMEEESMPFTPAVSLIYGLGQALTLMEEEGLEEVFRRHRLMMEMTRAAMRALGLPLLSRDDAASPTVTAVRPESFKADELRNTLKTEFGLSLAGGQQHLKGELFRIGHMGYCSPGDVLQTISMIEIGLERIGRPIRNGAGTAAAQQVYLERRVQHHGV